MCFVKIVPQDEVVQMGLGDQKPQPKEEPRLMGKGEVAPLLKSVSLNLYEGSPHLWID